MIVGLDHTGTKDLPAFLESKQPTENAFLKF